MRIKGGLLVLVLLLSISSVAGCSNAKEKKYENSDKKISHGGGPKRPRLAKEGLKNFKGLNMDRENIKLSMEGKELDLVMPVHSKKNRYYVPLSEIIDKLDGDITVEGSQVDFTLNDQEFKLDGDRTTYEVAGQTTNLSKEIIISDGFVYVSLFDLTKMLNLKTDWNYDEKKISLYKNREKIQPKKIAKSDKIALVRLEDFSASQAHRYNNAEALNKMRIIADYLYGEGVPFHVAWVPRYVDPRPESRMDNEPARQYSMYNSDFVFTLDYFTDRNGVIGLHGYTHQSGNDPSLDGFEFAHSATGAPASAEFAEHRVAMAKESAKALDIPIGFFELPHYSGSPAQLKVLEKNFDIVYNPYTPGGKDGYTYISRIQNGDKVTKYIPAPLNYIEGAGDTNNMINRVNSLPQGVMASFFYHTNNEFNFIDTTKGADGYPVYTYSDQSPLRRVVKAIEDKGYTFQKVTDLK